MAKLRSVILSNYRRFSGEIEFPLGPGVNLVVIPPGKGKSTLLEAIAWCLLGNELVSDPGEVPNVEALDTGTAEVRVALTFINGERLERFAQYSRTEGRVERGAWGWRLLGEGGGILDQGEDAVGFAEQAERLFPEECVHANLISGPSLARVAEGDRSGPERAVQCSDNWCTSDLSLRCSMEATGLFLGMCPETPVRALGYDPEGRLEVSVEGHPSVDVVRTAVLCHALAFARENYGVCPILMEDPLRCVEAEDRQGMFSEIIRSMGSRQVVFLLSDQADIEAVRATGRVDRELEIWG
ncbi:MAG: AAA family ATPase [Methanomassiliicoccus sp.]|nr:AAA family ATPase [Methanomassiliicoccus sp.]